MINLKIGTCSWKYDSWQGIVYSGKDKAGYLKEYAGQFNTVEVDQWFWSLFPGKAPVLPKIDTVRQYAESVPDGFEFSVKVPNSITLTHYYNRDKSAPLTANPHFLSNELFEQFLERLQPMGDKLGPLMFQFEYLNKQKMPSAAVFLSQFGEFIQQCPPGFKYALEIRNPNYVSKNYFQFLNDNNLAHVFLQGYYMPPIFNIFRQFGDLIQDWTVIRLHGPDRGGIEKRTLGNWSHIVAPKDEELAALQQMLQILLGRNVTVYLNVNNHYEGSAPRTIERIRGMVEKKE